DQSRTIQIVDQIAAAAAPHMLIEQLQVGPVIRGLVLRRRTVADGAQPLQVEAAEILKIRHDDAHDATRLEHAAAFAQQAQPFLEIEMLEYMRGIDRIDRTVLERQRLADVEGPNLG